MSRSSTRTRSSRKSGQSSPASVQMSPMSGRQRGELSSGAAPFAPAAPVAPAAQPYHAGAVVQHRLGTDPALGPLGLPDGVPEPTELDKTIVATLMSEATEAEQQRALLRTKLFAATTFDTVTKIMLPSVLVLVGIAFYYAYEWPREIAKALPESVGGIDLDCSDFPFWQQFSWASGGLDTICKGVPAEDLKLRGASNLVSEMVLLYVTPAILAVTSLLIGVGRAIAEQVKLAKASVVAAQTRAQAEAHQAAAERGEADVEAGVDEPPLPAHPNKTWHDAYHARSTSFAEWRDVGAYIFSFTLSVVPAVMFSVFVHRFLTSVGITQEAYQVTPPVSMLGTTADAVAPICDMKNWHSLWGAAMNGTGAYYPCTGPFTNIQIPLNVSGYPVVLQAASATMTKAAIISTAGMSAWMTTFLWMATLTSAAVLAGFTNLVWRRTRGEGKRKPDAFDADRSKNQELALFAKVKSLLRSYHESTNSLVVSSRIVLKLVPLVTTYLMWHYFPMNYSDGHSRITKEYNAASKQYPPSEEDYMPSYQAFLHDRDNMSMTAGLGVSEVLLGLPIVGAAALVGYCGAGAFLQLVGIGRWLNRQARANRGVELYRPLAEDPQPEDPQHEDPQPQGRATKYRHARYTKLEKFEQFLDRLNTITSLGYIAGCSYLVIVSLNDIFGFDSSYADPKQTCPTGIWGMVQNLYALPRWLDAECSATTQFAIISEALLKTWKDCVLSFVQIGMWSTVTSAVLTSGYTFYDACKYGMNKYIVNQKYKEDFVAPGDGDAARVRRLRRADQGASARLLDSSRTRRRSQGAAAGAGTPVYGAVDTSPAASV